MKKYFIINLILVIVIVWGCRKERDYDHYVPRVATNVTINLNLPEYNDLLNPGGWAYVLGGSRGIVVYRASETDFSAYDRHCPYNVVEGCKISIIEGSIAEDTECCHSQFEVITGIPISGKAERPLQSFKTHFNPNAKSLRIYN